MTRSIALDEPPNDDVDDVIETEVKKVVLAAPAAVVTGAEPLTTKPEKTAPVTSEATASPEPLVTLAATASAAVGLNQQDLMSFEMLQIGTDKSSPPTTQNDVEGCGVLGAVASQTPTPNNTPLESRSK